MADILWKPQLYLLLLIEKPVAHAEYYHAMDHLTGRRILELS